MDTGDRLLLRSVLMSISELQKTNRELWHKLDCVNKLSTDVKLLNSRLAVLKEYEDTLEMLEREHISSKAVAKTNKTWHYALSSILALFVPVAIAWFIRVNSELTEFNIITDRLKQQIVYLEERNRLAGISTSGESRDKQNR